MSAAASSSTTISHPAKYCVEVLDALRELLEREEVWGFVLDPFAGTGRVHDLAEPGRFTLGIELEPEWAAMHEDTQVGDATNMVFVGDCSIDAIVTSPPYGNRFADKDFRESAGANYAKALGRVSSDGSANHLQWGPKYKALIRDSFAEMFRVLKHGGKGFINISDHYRGYALQGVPDWYRHALVEAGFKIRYFREVQTKRFGYGANRHRPDCEYILVVEKP